MRGIFILPLLLAFNLYSQDPLITYQAEEKSLSAIFKDLEDTYGLHFAYSVKEVGDKQVSIDLENQPLSVFLDTLLRRHQLTYEMFSGGFISITAPSKLFIEFQLQDEESGEPLPFGTARIQGTQDGYVSNAKGIFEIEIPYDSEIVLELSFVGYAKKEINANEIDPSKVVTIAMKKDARTLKEVVVSEYLTKGINIDDQASSISINAQDMEILPGLSERDVLLSAQILAGIGSADESAGGLNIRGSSRDNTFIYWNNIPVYQSAHYFGNISAFIPSAIGKVDIYKNYIPVTYGGASAGLLLINSRKPAEAVVETNVNLTHGDVYASLPFANAQGQISLAARRSFNDVFRTPTFNSLSDKLFEGSLSENAQSLSEDFEYNSKLIFHDINLTGDLHTKNNDEFSFSFLNAQSELDYDSQDDFDFLRSSQEHNVNSLGSNFSWKRKWGDRMSSLVSTSYANYQLDYALVQMRNEEDEPDNRDLQELSNEIENIESRLLLTFSPLRNHVVDGGYQLNKVSTDLTFFEDFFFEENVLANINTGGLYHGIFANYFAKFDFGLQISLGLRQNLYESLGESQLDRQVRINYEIKPGILIKSSAGVYHQYISSLKEDEFAFSNFLEQNWISADEEVGIPLIKNEQLVAGLVLTKNGWVIDLDGYVKQVFLPLLWNFGFGFQNEELVISGTEVIKGIDLTIKKRWKRYRAWLSYTFQDSEIEAFSQQFPSNLNIRHQIQISQTLNHKQFEFSMGYTLKSGLPFTAHRGFEQISGSDEEDPFFEIIFEPINTSRLPDYHRVDLSAWYKFGSGRDKKVTGEVGLSILNILDANNLYNRTFSLQENINNTLFVAERNRALIGITPNISFRLKF